MWILRINHNSRSSSASWSLVSLLVTSVAWNRAPQRSLALSGVSEYQLEIVIGNRKIIPINGSASGPLLNSSVLLATGASICLESILSVHFLSQYHPHNEFRMWFSTFLEPNFISNLGHFFTCVHAEVVHPLINKMDESAILWWLFIDKK